jgi:hypothetical protein
MISSTFHNSKSTSKILRFWALESLGASVYKKWSLRILARILLRINSKPTFSQQMIDMLVTTISNCTNARDKEHFST